LSLPLCQRRRLPNSKTGSAKPTPSQISCSPRFPNCRRHSVPDLLFVVESDGQLWRAAFNSLKGTLTAKPLEAAAPLPWRNFLLRMHTTHVYPFSRGSIKWLWVLGADVMALVLIYWGISGLLMWWQIKSTRRWGLAILAVSAVAATLLAVGMHGVIHAG
jgi:hypothetical protein